MSKKVVAGVLVLIVILAGFVYYFYPSDSSSSFRVNTLLLKYSLEQGEEIITSVNVLNKVENEKSFSSSVEGLEGLVHVVPIEFDLGIGEQKNLEVIFKDEDLIYNPGVYVGSLVVQSGKEKKNVPIILEVKSNNPLFVLSLGVAPEYKKVNPGGDLFVELSAFNLNDTGSHQVKISYSIYDLNSELLLFEEESMILGGAQTSFTKTFTIPKDSELGDYVLAVLITNGRDSVSSSNYLFAISEDLGQSSLISFDYFLVIIFVFLFLIIVIIAFLIYERVTIMGELRRQQRREVRSITSIITQEKSRRLAKALTREKKEGIKKKFKSISKKVVKKISKKYVERKKIIKSLKREKKHNQISKRLEQWKKEGYDLRELGLGGVVKAKKIFANDLKKKGYDTASIGI